MSVNNANGGTSLNYILSKLNVTFRNHSHTLEMNENMRELNFELSAFDNPSYKSSAKG